MLKLPSSFIAVKASGNVAATSLSEDYNNSASPERKAAFIDALRAIDDRQREALARDRNIRLGSGVEVIDFLPTVPED
jgi:RecA/RadA recombinase